LHQFLHLLSTVDSLKMTSDTPHALTRTYTHSHLITTFPCVEWIDKSRHLNVTLGLYSHAQVSNERDAHKHTHTHTHTKIYKRNKNDSMCAMMSMPSNDEIIQFSNSRNSKTGHETNHINIYFESAS